MPRAYRAQVPPGFHWSLEVRMARASGGVRWRGSARRSPSWRASRPAPSSARPPSPISASGSARRILLRRGWQEVDVTRTRFINVDTTLYFEREPEGEWFALRPTRVADDRGIGVAEVVSYDARGRYGRALQAILANDAPA